MGNASDGKSGSGRGKSRYAPDSLEVSVSNPCGRFWHICWLPESQQLEVKVEGGPEADRQSSLATATDPQWSVFWHVLVSLDALEWAGHYGEHVVDGALWSLEFKRGKTEVRFSVTPDDLLMKIGTNPHAGFPMIIAAINMLAGREDIGIRDGVR